ncbi:MAG TPA: isoprenylcysteine carboxylmethyltransferase family protein [Anaerolineales bacterium]
MKSKAENPPTNDRPNLIAGILSRFGAIVFMLALEATILFLAAGRLDWIWAWIFIGINLAVVLVNGTILMRTNPEIVAERGRPKEVKDWDKAVSGVWALAQYLAIPLVAGLDARFGWTHGLGIAWNIAGGVVFTAGMALFGWAMITNAYFSTAARIQSDRGQTVCRSGPYRFVRHPGYSGTVLQSVGTSFLLGSLWSLIPTAAAVACMVARTVLEDRMLQNELPGYKDFARDIPHRLVPGVW